jgi:hypothetical protein
MLVVVAVVSVLVAVVVPGLVPERGMRAGQGARALIEGSVSRARAHAVATGEDTALVLVGYDAPQAGAGGRQLAVVALDPSGVPVRVLGNWEALPEGMVFLDQATAGAVRPAVFDDPARLEFSYAGMPVSGPFLRFDRRGALVHPGAAVLLDVLVGRGVVNGGQVASSERSEAGEAVYQRIRLGRLNGRTRVIYQEE